MLDASRSMIAVGENLERKGLLARDNALSFESSHRFAESIEGCVTSVEGDGAHAPRDRDPDACQIDLRGNTFRVFTFRIE